MENVMNKHDVDQLVITAELISNDQNRPFWHRLLIALGMILGLGAAAGMFWIFGILMFTFSLDAASSADIPGWVEPFMLIVWPALIVITVVLPATLFLAGTRTRRCVIVQVALALLTIISPFIAWITTIVAISK